jgi:hypothetical protein
VDLPERLPKDILDLFPNLESCGYSITSPSSRKYNCIAWAAGDVERKWWPVDDPRYYWPDVVSPRIENLNCFFVAFATMGYTVCIDGLPEPGFEKVAIYVDPSTGVPTHMARQLPGGEWTSKLGNAYDISHETPYGLESEVYGVVAGFLRREIGDR